MQAAYDSCVNRIATAKPKAFYRVRLPARKVDINSHPNPNPNPNPNPPVIRTFRAGSG